MLKPILDRILVEPTKPENKTKAGIIIPTTNEHPTTGIVVAVGKGKVDEPMELKEGDEILFKQLMGTPMKFDGKDYIMMTQDDVLGYQRK